MNLVLKIAGMPLEGETDQLFQRFKKGREQSKTTGLGLSLVKQICQLYQFDYNIIMKKIYSGSG